MKTTKYYTYKTFKRLGVPAIIYSFVSKLAARALFLPRKRLPVVCPSSAVAGQQHQEDQQVLQGRRVAIVTGSNTGVGFETARALVHDHGMEVIMACRSAEKAKEACENTTNATNNIIGKAVFLQPVDVSDLESVKSFAEAVKQEYKTIHALVNNAGRNSAGNHANPKSGVTESGSGRLEPIFTANFLGHFLLTNLLLSKCQRIVNLSSVMHHFPYYDKQDSAYKSISDPDYWRFMAMEPSPDDDSSAVMRKPYGASKLAALLFSVELNRRYAKTKGIRSIAVNPGSVYV